MSSYDQGVIIGRFLPPHNGHCYLVRFAQSYVRHLTLFLCSLPTEPIAGEIRCRWLRQLFPDVEIQHITESNRAAARGEPQAATLWAQSIQALLKRPAEVLFASEHYGAELAAKLQAHFVAVDIKRRVVSIHAKDILQNPMRYWEILPPPVQTHLVQRVVVVASQRRRSGEIAAGLAERFHTQWVENRWLPNAPEHGKVARQLAVEQAAQAQIADEEALRSSATRLLFTAADPRLQHSERWQRHLPSYNLYVVEEGCQELLPQRAIAVERCFLMASGRYSSENHKEQPSQVADFVTRWLSTVRFTA